jgi:hypothetical protein
MEQFIILLKGILPNTAIQKALFSIDIFSLCMLFMAFTISNMDFWLKEYILFMTAISITVGTAVKIYNFFTSNDENKKI